LATAQHLSPLEVLSLYPAHDYTLRRAFDTRAGADPSRPFLIFERSIANPAEAA
jgi:hypothetical protein